MSLPRSQTQPDQTPLQDPRFLRQANATPLTPEESANSSRIARTSANLDYYIFLLLSAFILLLSMVMNSHLLLFLAALTAPFLSPMEGVAISPSIPSWKHLNRSAVSIAITLLTYFLTGYLAGMIPPTEGEYPILTMAHLVRTSGLEWLLLAGAAVLLSYYLVHGSEKPRLASALMVYLVFFPAALSGLLYQFFQDESWLAVWSIVLPRVMIALLCMVGIQILLGSKPRKNAGWVMAGLLVLLTLLSIIVFGSSKFILTKSGSVVLPLQRTSSMAWVQHTPDTMNKLESGVKFI